MNTPTLNLFASFPHAVLAGVLVAAVCALLGVFVILKRVVFIGITLAETAACGVAVALMLNAPPFAGALLLTLLTVGLLAVPFENRRIPRDAVLGVLFVAASSLGVLLVAHSGFGLQEVKALLYGDLILATTDDLYVIGGVLIPAAVCLLLFIRPILYAFVDREAATVLGVRPARWELLFFLLLGLVVAAASKAAGALMVFCHLIAPAAAALLLVRRLWPVLILAVALAVASTLSGLWLSFRCDWPTNQTVCLVACALLPVTGLALGVRRLFRRHA